MKKYSLMAITLFVLVTSQVSFSEEAVSNRLTPSVGIGWIVPAEGDLDGGFAFGLGAKYTRKTDVFFLDWMYSATDVELSLFNIDSNVKHNIFQAGYLRNFGELNRWRAGAGVQVHQMNFSNLGRRSGTTLTGMLEYDLTERLTLRLQSAFPVNSETMDMGTALAVTVWSEI